MSSVNYRITNFDGIAFRSGLYVGAATQEVLVFNSSGAFVGAISPTSINTTGTLSVTGAATFKSTVTVSSTLTVAGITKHSNGTAAAPSITFSSATTGLYHAGTNILGFSTAGTTAGNIDASQNWSFVGNLLPTVDLGSNLGTASFRFASLFVSNLSSGGANTLNFLTNSTNQGSITSAGKWTVGASGSSQSHVINGTAVTLTTTTGSVELDLNSVDSTSNVNLKFNGATKWRLFNDHSSTDLLTLNDGTPTTVLTIAQGGVATFSGQLIGKGTATNDNASSLYIGQYIESVISTPTSVPGTTGVWGNMTSISLTAGDWDVTLTVDYITNGATSETSALSAISINSGTTTTDHVIGSNQLSTFVPTTARDAFCTISNYRLSLSGTTTVYAKSNLDFATATPQFRCRLSARRPR